MVYSRQSWDETKVVIYLRVSTQEQGNSGLGLDAQLAMCRRYAEVAGKEVVAVFSEVISGAVPLDTRPEFSLAVLSCNTHRAQLLVAKVDRLSRKMSDALRFIEKDIYGAKTPPLIVAERPNASELELQIGLMFAQQERKAISDRTKAALAERKKQGMNLGEAGRKAANDAKRELTEGAMKRATELRQQKFTLEHIANTLNDEGYTTSRGTQWTKQALSKRLSATASV